MFTTSYTWLITGASSGFGASLALSVLRSGHTVIACSRDIAKAKRSIPDVERLRGTWLELDVNSDSAEEIISNAVELHHVNVLVNSAGFALRGRIEDVSIEDAKRLFEPNFYGALRCIKGAIPHFRSRRHGTIVNISSVAGVIDALYYPLYSASMLALEGMSESIVADLAPFNVRVLLARCGRIRRAQSEVIDDPKEKSSEPHDDTAADAVRKTDEESAKRDGHLDKAADAIVDVVSGTRGAENWKGLLRLPLGKDAWIFAEMRLEAQLENLKRLSDVAGSVDFEA